MRLEGTPLGAQQPVSLADVGLFVQPEDLDGLSRLAQKALSLADSAPSALDGSWPPIAEVGTVRGASLAVDLSGVVAEAEAMARLSELKVDPPWLSDDFDGYASGVLFLEFSEGLENFAEPLLGALRVALPDFKVDEWWRWTAPGLAFDVTLSEDDSASAGLWESLGLCVHVSALAPFCCVVCQRTLRLRSADTTVSHLVDFGFVSTVSEAACAALGAHGYRKLSLRQAMHPVGPPSDGLCHEGPTTLFDVLFGLSRSPYGKPSVTSRYGSAL